MTPHQIALVRTSFALLKDRHPDFPLRFYERLFELDPTVRPLFPYDLSAQAAKLATMLGTVVAGLDRLHAYLPAIEALAIRHMDYGVTQRHYMSVGTALVDSLADALARDFDGETRVAWILAFGVLSTAMIDATRREAAARASLRRVA